MMWVDIMPLTQGESPSILSLWLSATGTVPVSIPTKLCRAEKMSACPSL